MGPRSTVKDDTHGPPSARLRRALLVDEDHGDLQYYLHIFEACGYLVRACRSYPEGARCLENDAFDFVLVTQGTPSFEGRCVLERAVEIDRRLPVLVVARCLDMNCYLEAMQLGAVDYLVEPLTVFEISRVLDNYPKYRSMAA